MKTKVIHIITKLELGGAQQNTIFTVSNLDREKFQPILWTGPEGILTAEAEKKMGADFKTIPDLVREVNPKRDLSALLTLRRLLKEEKRLSQGAPVIVHTHSSKAGILGRTAAWLADIPVVVHSFHGFGFNEFQPWPVRAAYIMAEKITGLMTDSFIFVSRSNMKRAEELGIGKPSQYKLVRSGIDLSEFRPKPIDRRLKRRELGIAEDGKLALMVACFKPQKNPVDFVRAAKLVLKEIPDAWFAIAGDGELRPELESAVKEAGIADRFKLLGWRRDVPELMWASDLLVLTSLWEGLPRVYPQAMSAGLAVVGTAVDGGPEAVLDGVNGYLTRPKDYEGIARRVVELFQDDSLRERMAKKGSEMVGEFDIGKMVKDQEALYRSLLQGKNLWN
jgi:glycosyltransferase involved in cell wall biosynthesis